MKFSLALLSVCLLLFPFFFTSSSSYARGRSTARIVSVSFVQGDTWIQPTPGAPFSAASMNDPVREGTTLETGRGSFAEIEFEDGSTARIGQLSSISFPELALTPRGSKITSLSISQGYATFHFMPRHHDRFQVFAARADLEPRGNSEFRTDLGSGWLRVEVFKGHVEASHQSSQQNVAHNQAFMFYATKPLPLHLLGKIRKDVWDKWVEFRDRRALAKSEREGIFGQDPFPTSNYFVIQ